MKRLRQTLTPMLAARWLKPGSQTAGAGRFARRMGRWHHEEGQRKRQEQRDQAQAGPDRREDFRETLRILYDLQDSHAALQAQVKSSQAASPQSSASTSSASVSRILGLPVEPSDTTQLADGTTLTFDKNNRRFVFK